MTFGDGISANQIGPIEVMQMSFLVMVPALFFFHKQYHPNDSDATPLLLVPTPFPFLRLIVPWSSWDSPTLPATLDLLPA